MTITAEQQNGQHVEPEDRPFGRPEWVEWLNLRRVDYQADSPHPDPSPCPSWCVRLVDSDPHEVDVQHGGDVVHSSEVVATRASLYRGIWIDDESSFAAVQSQLEQAGGALPTVDLSLRHYEYPGPKARLIKMRLSLADAEELHAVLGELLKLAQSTLVEQGRGAEA